VCIKRNKRRRRLQKTQNQIDCDFGSCTQRREAREPVRVGFFAVDVDGKPIAMNRDSTRLSTQPPPPFVVVVFLPGRITKIKRSVDTPVLGILFSHGKQNKVEIGRRDGHVCCRCP
jgi:hypothetical protein